MLNASSQDLQQWKLLSKNKFKEQIQASINRLFHTSFLQSTRTRKLSKTELQRYLSNIYFILLQTAPCLKLGAKVAEENGETELADFFQHKQVEEEGHFHWCEDDLKALLGPDYKWSHTEVMKPISQLMELQKSIILHDPKLYIGYITLVEALTVTLGPDVVANITKTDFADQPQVQLTCISKHIELDVDHVEDDYEVITHFLHTEQDTTNLLQHVENSTNIIYHFFEEIIHGTDITPTTHHKHVSIASSRMAD